MKEILREFEAYLCGHWLADLANFSAFFFNKTSDLNWIGFYLSDGECLRLGPFSGKPACTEISFQRGVCGAAFTQAKIFRVDDVHEFPGHIACDSASRSELVIPFYLNAKLVGVLDIDSPKLKRFSVEDENFFQEALLVLSLKISKFSGYPY